MSTIMSKRQQARNEKVLQDLVQNVPGNNFCADCQARNPSWASWSLGVFLCMRCAAIHRKLGTHISKVKSLSMDSWSNEQVENMKRVGNATSNKIHNPQNKKPPVPIDVDEADSAMERFIRSKYMQAAVNGSKKHNTGSSDEGTPPPLPPKTGGRFFSFRSKKDSRESRSRDSAVSSQEPQSPRSPGFLRNKQPSVFGASVHHDTPEATAQKLSQLRDMGFVDDKRNAMILKGVNGNLEKTIEALVRLGEGGGGSLPLPSPIPRENAHSTRPTSRSLTPQPVSPRPAIGLSKSSPPAAPSPATPSNNPWDIPAAQPQSTQSTGTLQNKNPFYAANPFDIPKQQPEFNLNQSLQNLSLTPAAQQPLFPNHTGGLPAQPISQSFYPPSMAPPIPQSQSFPLLSFNSNQTYPQPAPQPSQSYHNPFLQAPAAAHAPISLNTASQSPFQNQGSVGSNPFTRSPTRITSPTTLNQIPESSQQNFYGSSQTPYASNPFLTINQTAQPVQTPNFISPPQPIQPTQPIQQVWYDAQPLVQAAYQPAYQPPPQRPDTASIMALYNYPQLAPARPQGHIQNGGAELNQPAPPPRPAASPMPVSGSKNPFIGGAMGAIASPIPGPSSVASSVGPTFGSARSRESMTLGMEMAWSNGRHSPDAFASLSARSG
ncbi:ArfGap-domain-containing protein [Durotheca rogersii]|uniref:ArfGap-domain-containing protein n=1 Tax=Durotheca rogersii TaxID=419775 RepID=UPI002220F0F8|nr:ArfGap-domain-containing protein [Durotheca rogersii]KAI5860119.1 ArfGap-domain-containing protein [Durotheca rogersii]